jgi:hypothetical protein
MFTASFVAIPFVALLTFNFTVVGSIILAREIRGYLYRRARIERRLAASTRV